MKVEEIKKLVDSGSEEKIPDIIEFLKNSDIDTFCKFVLFTTELDFIPQFYYDLFRSNAEFIAKIKLLRIFMNEECKIFENYFSEITDDYYFELVDGKLKINIVIENHKFNFYEKEKQISKNIFYNENIEILLNQDFNCIIKFILHYEYTKNVFNYSDVFTLDERLKYYYDLIRDFKLTNQENISGFENNIIFKLNDNKLLYSKI